MVQGTEVHSVAVPNANFVFPGRPENGGSNPRFCEFDDLVLRIVKWHPSNHGVTATYSELVASRLAQFIDAPAFRGTVVHVDTQLLPTEISNRVSQPFHVGFTYSPGKNLRDTDYASIDNTAALPAAAVQLAWLQIGDQESHNQYSAELEQVLPDNTTRKMSLFTLVDQAAVCGTHDWSNSPLNDPTSPYKLPAHLKSRIDIDKVKPLVERVNAVEEASIRSCFEYYPNTWGLEASAVEKVITYILERRAHLEDILAADFKS